MSQASAQFLPQHQRKAIQIFCSYAQEDIDAHLSNAEIILLLLSPDFMASDNPDTIRAMIEEYRAGATYDFALDEADRGKKRITCPMLVLTCQKDDLKDYFDIEAIWREWAEDVRFERLDAGHYAAEERPEESYRALFRFFSKR